VLEVNPRASRTVPFVSKATGVQWAKVAAKLMTGMKLKDLGIEREIEVKHFAVKESVFPFNKFFGVDTILGPEMKSTGEVMGIDFNFGAAFWKSQLGAGQNLPFDGNVFLSVKNKDKRNVVFIAKKLSDLGFKVYATKGTGKILANSGIETTFVNKVSEGRPHVVDMIKNGEIHLIINTPSGRKPKGDEVLIRAGAVQYKIPYTTTISGAQAVVNAIETMKKGILSVKPLQDYYAP
jgi:carbamoyl-phosphate synthase large subunit